MIPSVFAQGIPPNIPLVDQKTKGFRIPLLTDPPEIRLQRQNTQNSSQVNNIFNKYVPENGGFNWSIIASCSPEDVAITNDVHTVEAIIHSLINSKFSQTEVQLFPNPITAKFFRLMQIGVKYLVDKNKLFEKSLTDAKVLNDELKIKIRSINEKASNLKAQIDARNNLSEKCPVCRKIFKNMDFLDKHIQRRHASLVPAWTSLRTGKLNGLEEIDGQLVELRRAISQTKSELLHSRINQQNNVVHIIDKQDDQLKELIELNEKQNKLIERQKNSERAQVNFRREMRNQLDNAIVALRNSQIKMVQEPIKLPPIQVSEDKPHKVEESLTSQLLSHQFDQDSPKKLQNPLNNFNFSDEFGGSSDFKPRVSFSKHQMQDILKDDERNKQMDSEYQIDPFVKNYSAEKLGDTNSSFEFPVNVVTTSKENDKPVRKQVFEFQFGDDDVHKKDVTKSGIRETSFDIPDKILSPKKFRDIPTKDYLGEDIDKYNNTPVQMYDNNDVEKIPDKHLKNGAIVDGNLFNRAKEFLEKDFNYSERPDKNKQVKKLTKRILLSVTDDLDKYKTMRPYARLSDVYVARKILEENDDVSYKEHHDLMLKKVDEMIPFLDLRDTSLYSDRQAVFPQKPEKQRPYYSQMHTMKSPLDHKYKEQSKISLQQRLDQEENEKNKNQRLVRKGVMRVTELHGPYDSDVEVVSHLGSESSASTVGFLSDPDWYKDRRPVEKKFKFINKISTSSSSAASVASNVIQPVDDHEEFDIKKIIAEEEDVNDQFFCESTGSERKEVSDKSDNIPVKGNSQGTSNITNPVSSNLGDSTSNKLYNASPTSSAKISASKYQGEDYVRSSIDITSSIKQQRTTNADKKTSRNTHSGSPTDKSDYRKESALSSSNRSGKDFKADEYSATPSVKTQVSYKSTSKGTDKKSPKSIDDAKSPGSKVSSSTKNDYNTEMEEDYEILDTSKVINTTDKLIATKDSKAETKSTEFKSVSTDSNSSIHKPEVTQMVSTMTIRNSTSSLAQTHSFRVTDNNNYSHTSFVVTKNNDASGTKEIKDIPDVSISNASSSDDI